MRLTPGSPFPPGLLMSMLLLSVPVKFPPARYPMAVLPLPAAAVCPTPRRAWYPTAVLSFPVLFHKRASYPTATFASPVVFIWREIGRASCRERGEVWVGGGLVRNRTTG